MAIETWKAVASWEGLYDVSDHGRVRSVARAYMRNDGVAGIKQERLLKPFLRNGYPAVAFLHKGRKDRVYIHRLVCAAFHGAPPLKHEVGHTDGTRTNNHASNLRWVTRIENMHDKYRHGTNLTRENHPLTKIPAAEFDEVMRRLLSGENQRVIAKQYGVDQSTLSKLKTRHERISA